MGSRDPISDGVPGTEKGKSILGVVLGLMPGSLGRMAKSNLGHSFPEFEFDLSVFFGSVPESGTCPIDLLRSFSKLAFQLRNILFVFFLQDTFVTRRKNFRS